jgi:hypothetical protein
MVPFPRWKTKNLVAYADPIRPCMAPYGSDNFIYYVFSHDLYRIPKTTTKTDRGPGAARAWLRDEPGGAAGLRALWRDGTRKSTSWRCDGRTIMTNTPVKLGTRKAKGTPNIFGTDIWFQGEDDLLWVMPLDDPSKAINPQGLKTMSTPQPSDDGYVYFQGEGNKLIAIQQHFPYLYTNLGGCECWEVPVAPKDGFVYFRNGAGKLSRISLDRADNFAVENYNFSTAFAPAVHVDHNVCYLFYADGSDRALRGSISTGRPTAPATSGLHTRRHAFRRRQRQALHRRQQARRL